MAEIIAEPTALSKVIALKFKINDVDVPKTTQLPTNKQFNTTDTDAWFTFELDGLASINGTYDLTLINLDDKSIFHHADVIFPALPFHYKLNSSEDVTLNEIRHAGRWLGQLVVTLSNGDTTARQFGFNIAGHILDGQDAQVILLSDYQALINTINLAKDDLAQYNVDYSALLVDIAAAEDARVTAYNQLLADQQANIEAFDVALDEGIVAANLAQKLQDFEETNNSRLLSAEQQLAETIRIDESNLSLNNFNENDRAVIQGLAEGEINAVLGLGNVERENIADKAVTPEKTSFIDTTNLLISNEVQVGKTIGTDSQVGDDSGRWLGGYIPVSSGEILSITPGAYRIQYYNKSRSPVGTRSGVSGGTFTVYVDSIIQFIRISGANSNQYDKVMLNRGSTLLPFQPYGILKKEHLPEDEGLLLGEVETENIADKAVTPEKTSFIDTTNLLISNEVQVGKTIGTDSQVGDDSGRWLGGYIPVSSGEILSITPGAYRIQYYNKSRSPVGTRSGVSGGTFTVYVDSIIQFIRISGANSNQYDKVMLNRGSTLLPFQPYGILKKEHLPEDEGLLLGEVETENIADKAVTPEKTSFIDTTNLLISNEVQVGKTIGTDSQVGDDSGRWLGGYIPVSSGEILSITPGAYRIQYYNKSRSPVGTRSGVSGGTFTVYVDSIIQFIRISGANSNQYDKVMLNRGSTLLPFQPYGILKKEHLPEDEGLLLGEVETENIADKAVTPEKTSFIDTTNLLISNEVQVGKTIGTDSQVGDDSGRWLGGYIPVSSGEILSITPGSYRIQYYNKSRSPVGTRSGVSGGTFTVYVDSIIQFIRISGANSNQYDKVMLNRGSTLLPFQPYGILKKEHMPSDLQIDTDQIVAQIREEMKGQLTQYQPSFPKLTFETVTTGWSIPKWMSADGEVIYGDFGGELLQSFDEWETRTRIGNAPLVSSIAGMRELGDGELLVSTNRDESINLKSKVFKTVGYDRNNPGATTFKEVLEADSAQANINNWWGFSVYDNIVTISDYGLKGAEGAKNVWVSTDYGETFTLIFNQHTIGQEVAGAPPYTATAHMHTAAYDPYFNRIWVVVGDNPNTATYYSDDMGTSWTFVEGSTVVQYTGIIALPNAVLFGSDRNPNGVHVYHRGNKSDMPVIKPLLLVNDSKVITHVFQMPFKRDWHPTTPVYFASEGISAAGGRAVIIGTVDGKTANLMFEADLSGPYSGNMHSPLGPTAQGNIVSYMEDSSISGYRTVKAKAPTWSRV